MHFLRPELLPLTGLAVVPPLIHLLNRRRLRRVDFSNMAFLFSLDRERMSRIRLKGWLLLALRTSAVAFLSLAAAGPTLRKGGIGGHARTSAVLLVDVSCSTRLRTERGRVLDLERDRALEVLGTLRGGDRVWVVPFGSRPHEVHGPSGPEEAEEYVRSISPTYEGTDFVAALRKAFSLLEGEGANREVYLITDWARHGWSSEGELPKSEGVNLFVLPVGGGRENLGAVGIRTSGLALVSGGRARVRAYVCRYGGEGEREVSVDIYLEGRRIAHSSVELKGSGEVPVEFSLPLEGAGEISGFVRVEEDELPEDDRWYFVLSVVDSVDVLASGPPPEAQVLKLALSPPGPVGTPFRVLKAEPEGINSQLLKDVEVVLLADVEGLPPSTLYALKDFVRGGGGLGIFLGGRADVRWYNEEVLPELIPGRLGPLKGSPRGEEGYFAPKSWSPTLKDLLGRNSFKVFLFYPFLPGEGTKPLIELSDGSVVSAESGDGKVFIWSGGLPPDWGDITLRGVFLPLLYRLVLRAAFPGEGRKGWTGGRLSLEFRGEGPLKLEGPEGESFTLWPKGSSVTTPPLDSPGIWRLSGGGRVIALIPVNVPPRERDLRKTLEGGTFCTIPQEERVADVVRKLRYGRELGWPFALLAFSLLLAELALGRARTSEGA